MQSLVVDFRIFAAARPGEDRTTSTAAPATRRRSSRPSGTPYGPRGGTPASTRARPASPARAEGRRGGSAARGGPR